MALTVRGTPIDEVRHALGGEGALTDVREPSLVLGRARLELKSRSSDREWSREVSVRFEHTVGLSFLSDDVPSVQIPEHGGGVQMPRHSILRPRHHLLTETLLRFSRVLRAIVVSKALQSGFAIDETALDVEDDPEEKNSKTVLRIYTPTSAAQAMAFWDSLATDLDRWLPRLSESDRQAVLTQLGLRFHWHAAIQSS